MAVWRDLGLLDRHIAYGCVENSRTTEKELFEAGRLDHDLDRGKPDTSMLLNCDTDNVQLLFIPCAVCALVSTSNGLGVRDDQLQPRQIITASMVGPHNCPFGAAAEQKQCLVLQHIRSSLLHHTRSAKM